MKQLYYYYDPHLKLEDGRYSVDYFCTDSKRSVWAGRLNGDTYDEVLRNVKKFIDNLNKRRSFFERLMQRIWWRKRTRNL